jgi:hypothetical protein
MRLDGHSEQVLSQWGRQVQEGHMLENDESIGGWSFMSE